MKRTLLCSSLCLQSNSSGCLTVTANLFVPQPLINICILIILQVEIEATTTEPGTALRAPTVEAGLVPACKDTCYGDLRLQLWEKKYDGSKGEVCLHYHEVVGTCFLELSY